MERGLTPWLGALLTLISVWAVAVARRALRSRRAKRRAAVALAGERDAERLLAREGFVVEAKQAAASYVLGIDGTDTSVGLRADLIVSRGGRRFVAEVKTGTLAPRPEHPPTRRQLLEYAFAYGCDGVLLVDAEARAIREIEFRGPSRAPTATPRVVWLLVAAVVAGAWLWGAR